VRKGCVVKRIPVSGPWITEREIAYVTDAITNGWYENASCYHARFEQAFASYIGVRFALALPSCTSGIHLALAALGVGPGDEVIVPEITWIASAAPIIYVGGIPVFADVDPRTWCLSPNSFESCITPRTRAVIPVDLYGGIPQMDVIGDIARARNIAVIEDAAEAIGSEFKRRKAGSLGDVGVFSFHGSKTLTTGEGGMLVTDREELYQRFLVLRDHGRQSGDKLFFNTEIAYKYKMSGLQAALGLAQLERIEELIARKRLIYRWYQEELADTPAVTLNHEPPDTKSTYWMVTIVLPEELGLTKKQVLDWMDQHRIDCRPFFHPLSSLPAFRDHPGVLRAQERNKVSYRISPYAVNLPSGLNLTRETVQYVCDRLKALLAQPKLSRDLHRELV